MNRAGKTPAEIRKAIIAGQWQTISLEPTEK
jgi:hypothetical protein